MKPYNVLISYSRKDDIGFKDGKESQIDNILKSLKKANISYWIDREGKYKGESYILKIQQALSTSEMVLFISSANSNCSKWVVREIFEADNRNMKIIPLLLDNTPFNSKISLIFNGIDRIEYFNNNQKGLNDLIGSIDNHLQEIKTQERIIAEEKAAEEKKKQEAAEEKKIKEAAEKERKEKEEKQRIAKIEEEINGIKKHLEDLLEKQQIYVEQLLSKEKDLNRASSSRNKCPVCNTLYEYDIDYCDICSWHFATPGELINPQLQQLHDTRLSIAKTVWSQKEQSKEKIQHLTRELNNVSESQKQVQAKLSKNKEELRKANEINQSRIQMQQNEISKLLLELDVMKNAAAKDRQLIIELNNELKISNEFKRKQSITAKVPIAFLLVTEFDQTNVYCLYEGRNSFGAMEQNKSEPDYQMLVVAEMNLKTQHFSITITKENRTYNYMISPQDNSCTLALNSSSNIIKSTTNIYINDILFIGNVKIQLSDNFNKLK